MKIDLLNITAKCLSKMNNNILVSGICGIIIVFLGIYMLLTFEKNYFIYYRALLNLKKEFEKDKVSLKKIFALNIGYFIGCVVYFARKHKKENKPLLEGFNLGEFEKTIYATIVSGLCLSTIASTFFIIVTDFFDFLNR